MEASPLRVIALCSEILGVFFLAKSISIKTPKYVLHELLAYKVNKSRFFRRYIAQKLESIIGFVFLFVGFAIEIHLEVEALGSKAGSTFESLWRVVGWTVLALLAIAVLLNKITRFFSGKIFVEHVKFMVEEHGYPLDRDDSLVRELGRILKVSRDEEDTVESYADKVLAKMKVTVRTKERKGPRGFR